MNGSRTNVVRAVCFDWGGTVMRELPGMTGPMASWPRVEAIPGVKDALRALHGRYRLAVATNAAASDAALVRAALARVGLSAFFDAVCTARDLGAEKPDPAFFHGVLTRLNCSPAEAAMVGDGYATDVVGAKQAGLWAIWFNPSGDPCPCVHPLHDAELRDMAALPAALSDLRLPDLNTCLELLAEHGVPAGVVRHSLAVAAAAHHLAHRLRERGARVDPLLAHRGGLLHDLDKVMSLQSAGVHGRIAAGILSERGFPELAAIAERHVLGAQDGEGRPQTWEEKLVFYADKIVEGDQVVGIEPRLAALRYRYPAYVEDLERSLPYLRALETEIARRVGSSPEELMAELRALDPSLSGERAAPCG